MGYLCCARELSVQFLVQFFYPVKLHSLTYGVWGALQTVERYKLIMCPSRHGDGINTVSGLFKIPT